MNRSTTSLPMLLLLLCFLAASFLVGGAAGQRTQFVLCDICAGLPITDPQAILVTQDDSGTICQSLTAQNNVNPNLCFLVRAFDGLTCEVVQTNFLSNPLVTQEECEILPFIVGDDCGCTATPPPTGNPTPSPTPAPTLAPVLPPSAPPVTPPTPAPTNVDVGQVFAFGLADIIDRFSDLLLLPFRLLGFF